MYAVILLPMDASGITLTLGLINSAMDAAKKAVGIAKDLNNIELKQQLSEVYSSVPDLKIRLTELQIENDSLKNQLETKAKISFDDSSGFYFVEGLKSPLCPACYQGREHLVVHFGPPISGDSGSYYRCSICRNTFDL
jgi:hypothetical protein